MLCNFNLLKHHSSFELIWLALRLLAPLVSLALVNVLGTVMLQLHELRHVEIMLGCIASVHL